MRIGVCARPEAAAEVAAAGFDYIELPVSAVDPEGPALAVERVAEQLEKAGLRAEAFNVLLPGHLTLCGPQVDEARIQGYLATAMQRVAQLGAEVVVWGSGRARAIPEGWPAERAREQLVAFARWAADAAARAGVKLVIEPLNRKESNVFLSVAEAAEFARALAHPALGVLADLYHVEEEDEPHERVASAGSLLWHAHVAVPHSRLAPGPEHDPSPFVSFFSQLKRIGYRRRVSIEGKWVSLAQQGPGALAFLRRAWEAA